MPDAAIVAKFRDSGDLGADAVPVASLAMLWYLDSNGQDGVLSKFDGDMRVSITIGDLTALIHQYLHADGEED